MALKHDGMAQRIKDYGNPRDAVMKLIRYTAFAFKINNTHAKELLLKAGLI